MSRLLSLEALLGYVRPKKKIADPFDPQPKTLQNQVDWAGTPIVKITDANMGQYEFMPVVINDGLKDYEIPNAVIMITGEKGIIETDVIDRGTVFEKVYERPYDISIVMTLIGDKKEWPAEAYKQTSELYRGKRYDEQNNKSIVGRDLVTLRCALTNPFLQQDNNFLITKIAVLDNEGAENVEVIQIDGRSNIDFELVIN